MLKKKKNLGDFPQNTEISKDSKKVNPGSTSTKLFQIDV